MTLFDEATRSRCRLVVAYDGTDFRGYATQPDVRTVEGVLAKGLERVLRHPPVDLSCAGRTDAGVHALGQVVTFEADPGVDPWRIQSSLNGMLAPEIVVRESDLVDGSFDARHSARWRRYHYTVLNRPTPDPFLARFSWWVPEPLDLKSLHLGADPFVGEHDFASFCRKGPKGSSLQRRVFDSRWHDDGDGILRYEIRANAFCWQMVRSVVGTLVDVGSGRHTAGEITAMLRARDRATAGQVAPPHGLCLTEVGYD